MKNFLAAIGLLSIVGLALLGLIRIVVVEAPSESYARIKNKSETVVTDVSLEWLGESCFVSSLSPSSSLRCNLGGLSRGETGLNVHYVSPTMGKISKELYIAGAADEFYEITIEKGGNAKVEWGLQVHNKTLKRDALKSAPLS